MFSRRAKIIAGVAAGAPLVGAAIAWWGWLPSVATDRAIAAAEARGFETEIEDASLGLSGVEFHSLTLNGKSGGLSIAIENLEVEASLFSVLTDGASAVESISAEGVVVTATLGDDFQESLSTIRDARTTSTPATPADTEGDSGSSREYSATGVSVSVSDADGALLAVEGGSLTKEDAGYVGQADEVRIGSDSSDHAELTGVIARLSPERQLTEVRASGGVARWLDGVQVAENAEESGGLAESPLVLRLERALQSARPTRPESESPGSPSSSRLAEDFRVGVADFTVESGHGEESTTVMSGLRAEVTRLPEGMFHATGTGSPGEGGELGWDLRISPDELRGEGNITFHELPLAVVTPFLPAIPWHEAEHARLDGDVVLEADGPDRIDVRGTVSLRDAALNSPRLANNPVGGIGFEVAGEGTWISSERKLLIDTATLGIGSARASMNGSLLFTPDRYAIDVRAALPLTDCNAAIGAIPDDLLERAAGFSWEGRLAARVEARIDSDALSDAVLEIDVTDGCEFRSVPAMADLRRVEGPFDHRVLEPDGSWFEMVTGPGTGSWTSIYGVSPFLVHAVLSHEDGGFFRHGGFATYAIRDALVRNLTEGRFVYGASTITMQLAKNLFLHRQKTLARKVQEVLLTWWLESALEKRDILELYLNVIEYGPGVYGIRQAAWHYFGRSPDDLSPAESTFLAAVLPAPKSFHVHRERGSLSASMANRLRRQLRHQASRGRIDDAALAYGLEEIPSFRFRGGGGSGNREVSGSASPLPFGSPGNDFMDGIVDPWAAVDDYGEDSYHDEPWEDVTPEPEG